MADTAVHIGENSPEKIAYELMRDIAKVERKLLYWTARGEQGETIADRQWILDTFAECMEAVNTASSRVRS